MYTLCPGCKRQFRIYAEHIAAASGQVRCGFCHAQFNALEALHDEPLPAAKLPESATEANVPDEPTPDEPQFEIPDSQTSVVEVDDIVIDRETGASDEELERSIAEIGAPALATEPEPAPPTINLRQKRPAPEQSPSGHETPAQKTKPVEEADSPRYPFDDEEPLLDDTSESGNSKLRSFWAVATLVAVLLLAGQLAWFNRDTLLQKYPEARPYVVQMCERLGCAVIRERDTQAIALVNRDVRLHPRFQDTLLVNVTMQNELPVRQPYPRVQLTLFDTAGALIGYREFLPTDYLDNSIDMDEGMPADAPVHFVLEVTGSSEEAVSFEFRFL